LGCRCSGVSFDAGGFETRPYGGGAVLPFGQWFASLVVLGAGFGWVGNAPDGLAEPAFCSCWDDSGWDSRRGT
jgi:hypothetical protein